MARYRASQLYRELMAESSNSGKPLTTLEDLKRTQTFANIREACGIDRDNNPMREVWGAETNMKLRENNFRPDQEYAIPVRNRPHMTFDDWSLRDLFENLVRNKSDGQPVGRSFVEDYMSDERGLQRLQESGSIGAVDYSLFYGITGQLMITAILQGFTREEFAISNLCPTYPTRFMDGERIPGMGLPADPDKGGIEDITLVKENQPYKMVGFGEEYIELPATDTRGLIIGLTRLAIYGDRTGLITQRANEVGYLLGLRKEKRAIGALIGGTVNPCYFKEKRLGNKAITTVDAYQYSANTGATDANGVTCNRQFAYAAGTLGAAAGTNQAFYNDIPNNPLRDYTAFRTADQAFSKVVDPNTGEPVVVGRPFVILPYTRKWDIIQIVQAMNIFKLTQAGGSTGAFGTGQALTQTPNAAMSGMLAESFITSRQLRAQLVTQLGMSDADCDYVWFNGDFAEALKYSENWPITVTQAPPQSEAEFAQDVMVRFKASERGNWGWWNPRVVQRHNFQQENSGL